MPQKKTIFVNNEIFHLAANRLKGIICDKSTKFEKLEVEFSLPKSERVIRKNGKLTKIYIFWNIPRDYFQQFPNTYL